jgi:hypothetical protein
MQLACRLEAGGKLVLVDFCRCGGWYLLVSMYMVKRGASEHAEQHEGLPALVSRVEPGGKLVLVDFCMCGWHKCTWRTA